ncbi:glycosyltransferase [Yersinia ruckeri]|uniref:glycosyltransferase n=1 Tax=Yersinia ruckeri TaxID=29486 RepID=UPI0022648B94|nr:glycosyltransferase [Yersinia ruckeri]UZX67882.1 glycosyltransferase [Yersinia ruckeri]
MHIIVNATALFEGGAKTILLQFINNAEKDIENSYYIFISNKLALPNAKNIFFYTVEPMGWFGRIRWDSVGLLRYCNRLHIDYDIVISLQNTSIKTNKEQYVYIHQSLPFTKERIILNDFLSLKLVIYRYFYLFFIKRFITNKTYFIVQTEWMKNALMQHFDAASIYVICPDYSLPSLPYVPKKINGANDFIILYPAKPICYKNHMVLIDALYKLKNDGVINCVLLVTFSRGECKWFDRRVAKLDLFENIEYLGVLEQSTLANYYMNCDTVVFPSYIETFGLPLAEAASLNKYIIASDLPYAKEVLSGYDKVIFTNYLSSKAWAENISKLVSKKHRGELDDTFCDFNFNNSHKDGWSLFFKLINKNK